MCRIGMVQSVQQLLISNSRGRFGEMVGKQHRQAGVVGDVGDRSAASAPSGARRYLRRDERDAQIPSRAIAPNSSSAAVFPHISAAISNPPPKDINDPPQANEIWTKSQTDADPRANVSERSIESASTSSGESGSASARESTRVGTSAHAARRATRRESACEVGRDAARDLGRSAGRAGDAERWLTLLAPRALPPGVECTVNDSHSKWYRLRLAGGPLTVILEIEVWQGALWAHLAVTGRGAPPALAEIGYCRDLFLGDRKAIQILPRRLEAAEAGARTSHLYAQLESDCLPSFCRAIHPSPLEQ